MPITSSAKKAMKVSARRHQENLTQRTILKRSLKDARRTVATDAPNAEVLSKAQSSLDRAVKTNLMHRNTASRLFSRLVKHSKQAA